MNASEPTPANPIAMGVRPVVESEYEVKLGIFEGPLDLLLYLVQKNELDPRSISIATITDQYLVYIDGLKDLNLGNAGEFLVMAARLMRLKARELLPADQKDELEEMEYELDRQALIQQMLEYQKFKEAARVLRNFEGNHFGALPRGRAELASEGKDLETEEEAGIFDLLSAFRKVVLQRPRPPIHEVEIDDVTIEDKMQEVEIVLQERGRSLFEDLFALDQRTIVQVVTFMAILELAKLDRILFRQSHGSGPIWIYRKQGSAAYEMELKVEENHLEPLPEFKPGLVDIVKEQIKQRTAQNALEAALRELEQEILSPGQGAAKGGTVEMEATGEPSAEAEAVFNGIGDDPAEDAPGASAAPSPAPSEEEE